MCVCVCIQMCVCVCEELNETRKVTREKLDGKWSERGGELVGHRGEVKKKKAGCPWRRRRMKGKEDAFRS